MSLRVAGMASVATGVVSRYTGVVGVILRRLGLRSWLLGATSLLVVLLLVVDIIFTKLLQSQVDYFPIMKHEKIINERKLNHNIWSMEYDSKQRNNTNIQYWHIERNKG